MFQPSARGCGAVEVVSCSSSRQLDHGWPWRTVDFDQVATGLQIAADRPREYHRFIRSDRSSETSQAIVDSPRLSGTGPGAVHQPQPGRSGCLDATRKRDVRRERDGGSPAAPGARRCCAGTWDCRLKASCSWLAVDHSRADDRLCVEARRRFMADTRRGAASGQQCDRR